MSHIEDLPERLSDALTQQLRTLKITVDVPRRDLRPRIDPRDQHL